MAQESDHNYTKRELDEKFKEVKDHLSRQDEMQEKILVQTTATNGKVASLQGWRQYITGGLAVLTALLIPVLLYVVAHVLKVNP